MEHEGEVWQELDYNGERINGIEPREFDYDEVRLYSGAAVMLYRYNPEVRQVEFLFQKRAKNLRSNPESWDVSAGGHVNLDEPMIETVVRETKEEIGVEIEKEKLEFAAKYLKDKLVIGLYFYDFSEKEDDFHFNDNEVDEVKWVGFDELDEFWPGLKNGVNDDTIFKHYLTEWNTKILQAR